MGKELNLLGMQKGKKYCLLSNNIDRSNAKNFIAYRLAKDIKMPCSIDERYVSLFLNGHYNGLYLLTNELSVTSSGISKHQIYQIEYNEESFRIKYPKKNLSAEDDQFLHSCYRDMLDALITTKDSADNSFMSYLDANSFAKYYLLQELFFNYDWGNFYMSINSIDKKFRALALWDLDQSMGMQHENENVIENSSRLYSFKLGRWYRNESKNSIFGLLCKKVAFLDSIRTIFADSLSPMCRHFLDDNSFRSIKEMLLYENSLDYARWASDNNGSEIDDIRTFILQRLAFLEKEMWQRNADEQMVKMVCYQPRKGLNRMYEFPVRKGSYFVPPVSHLLTFRRWKNKDGETFGDSILVECDTTITADWWSLPSWFKFDRSTIKRLSDQFN